MADTVVAFPSQQVVAPYEANLIAQADQKRLAVASRAGETLAGLRAGINRIDHSLGHYAQELAAAWQQAKADDQSAYSPALPAALYWGGVGLLLCLEMALNMAAVEHLRMTPLHAWATAGFIGLVNCCAAKSTARVVRQQSWSRRAYSEWLLALISNVIIVLALHELAQLRALDSGSASFAASNVPMVSGDLANSAAPSIEVRSAAASPMVFLLLQVGGYVAVLLLSFFQLDPSSEREQLTKRVARLEGRVTSLWKQRAVQADRHNKTLSRTEHVLDDIVADASERVFQYRDANMRSRLGDDPPGFFAQAVSTAAFKPIELGEMVDHQPLVLAELVNSQLKGDHQ